MQHAIERVGRPGGSHEGVGRKKNVVNGKVTKHSETGVKLSCGEKVTDASAGAFRVLSDSAQIPFPSIIVIGSCKTLLLQKLAV